MKFVNLHNHTHYSILDSLITPKELFIRAKELGQPAVAINDHGNLAGVWDAFKVSKEVGIKYIVGCEFYFHSDRNALIGGTSSEKIRHINLIAKNIKGYKNLLYLNKISYDNSAIFGKKVMPLLDWSSLENNSDGLICLTSCGHGIVSQSINLKNFDQAERDLNKLKEIFGSNLAVEVQANNLTRNNSLYHSPVNQIFTNYHLIRLAQKNNIKIVPTTNSHYLRKEDAEMHDVFLAIGAMQPAYSNARLRYISSPDFYLKSEEEVVKFFARNYGDSFANEICNNTFEFASMCEEPEWIDPKFTNPSGKELPVFPVKDERDYQEFLNWLKTQPEEVKKIDEDKAFLRFRCMKNFYSKVPSNRISEYEARLKEELDVLEYHGFSSYMLIVADMIDYARKNGISVGPGRGSVAGSLVAYLIGIHQVDSIKYDLIFARFHNKFKTSMPDCDVDYSPSGRDKVQEYIKNKYGAEYVAHVSNINTITPKVFARDISRSCELAGDRQASVKLGNDIADSIPKDLKDGSIKDVFEKAPLFSEYAKRYTQLKRFSNIVGKNRAWATHAAGVVISKRPLHHIVPVRKDKDGAIALQLDKNDAEECGLVKMDTLGLETLDIINEALSLIKKNGKQIKQFPPNYDEYDKETYDLISRGDVLCVFQLGTSGGTIELCKKIKPKSIEDISHINALARPSAKDIRKSFIEAKEGKKKFKLMHPSLERSFGKTFGFGLYEESLMYLAQDVAGWSLHEADRLRKLTKEKGKNPEKALKWRDEFIEDALKNKNISKEISMKIWDEVISSFGSYGFNAAHSISYSLLSYQTAYLKAHYPVEFLLANLLSENRSTNKKIAKVNIDKIKHELRLMGVKVLPPDLNTSESTYTLVDNNAILTGLDALKFVGEDAVKDIVQKRPFSSFNDFMIRVDSHAVRSNTIQALAAAGCFDSFGIPRKTIYLYCSDYRKKLQSWSKKNNPADFKYTWPKDNDWSVPEKYALEKNYLGESFKYNKIDAYGTFFKTDRTTFLKEIKSMKNKENISLIKAEVKSVFELKIKKIGSKLLGETMVKATIEDQHGEQCSLTIFPDRLKEIKDKLRREFKNKYALDDGLAIAFSASVNVYEDDIGLVLDRVYDIQPPPQLPNSKNLKPKAIDIIPETEKENKKNDINTNIEDELYDLGLIDFTEEED